MNLQYKNFCVLVVVLLTLLFCTPVFAQGPSDLAVSNSTTASVTAAPAIPDAPAPMPSQGPGPVSTYPNRKYRR